MTDDMHEIDREWNQLSSAMEDDMEVEFLDDDDLLEFVHDTEF
jgi:hypothetical protein